MELQDFHFQMTHPQLQDAVLAWLLLQLTKVARVLCARPQSTFTSTNSFHLLQRYKRESMRSCSSSAVQGACPLCGVGLHGEPSGMKSHMCFPSLLDSSNGRAGHTLQTRFTGTRHMLSQRKLSELVGWPHFVAKYTESRRGNIIDQ